MFRPTVFANRDGRLAVPGARRLPVFARLALASLIVAAIAAIMPATVHAQLSRVPQVALLDFDDRGDQTGGILSRQATDAIANEMTRTGRFDVTPRQQVVQQIRELNLPEPLDTIALRKLGQALGVDYVATGRIVRRTPDAAGTGKARVTLAIVLTDPSSGDPANGALATGEATPPQGASSAQDTLVRATSNAAFLAVEQMNNYQLPEATVLNARPGEVLLNRGGRDGVTVGQEFVILRGRERIGRARVISVQSTDATATVTDRGRGIRPEDRARAIFALPELGIGAR